MNLPLLGSLIDERFLNHRQRATSLMGIAGALVALVLFYYRWLAAHVWSWDLFAVIATMLAVKLGVMAWYLFTD